MKCIVGNKCIKNTSHSTHVPNTHLKLDELADKRMLVLSDALFLNDVLWSFVEGLCYCIRLCDSDKLTEEKTKQLNQPQKTREDYTESENEVGCSDGSLLIPWPQKCTCYWARKTVCSMLRRLLSSQNVSSLWRSLNSLRSTRCFVPIPKLCVSHNPHIFLTSPSD